MKNHNQQAKVLIRGIWILTIIVIIAIIADKMEAAIISTLGAVILTILLITKIFNIMAESKAQILERLDAVLGSVAAIGTNLQVVAEAQIASAALQAEAFTEVIAKLAELETAISEGAPAEEISARVTLVQEALSAAVAQTTVIQGQSVTVQEQATALANIIPNVT